MPLWALEFVTESRGKVVVEAPTLAQAIRHIKEDVDQAEMMQHHGDTHDWRLTDVVLDWDGLPDGAEADYETDGG